jgi:hypothetical protein
MWGKRRGLITNKENFKFQIYRRCMMKLRKEHEGDDGYGGRLGSV